MVKPEFGLAACERQGVDPAAVRRIRLTPGLGLEPQVGLGAGKALEAGGHVESGVFFTVRSATPVGAEIDVDALRVRTGKQRTKARQVDEVPGEHDGLASHAYCPRTVLGDIAVDRQGAIGATRIGLQADVEAMVAILVDEH